MEYNKKRFAKLNNHKILHKVRKHWVVISLALLGVISGGAITNANADADNTSARFDNESQRQDHSSQVNQNTVLASSSANHKALPSQLTSLSVSQRAANLHNHILTHAFVDSNVGMNYSNSVSSNIIKPAQQKSSSIAPIVMQSSRKPQVQTEKWGQTQIKFVSDGSHGNAGGDVAEVEPGAISDSFYEQNNSDINYGTGKTGCYIVNRYNDNLQLPFDQASNNWSLKFAPGVILPKNDGVSKNNQAPKNGENSSDVDYEQGTVKTNDYRYLFSSTNRTLWNHFKTMDLTNLNTDNAEDLSNMFFGDQSLQKVILNDSANPKLTELHGMFADDPQLREVDFNHFNAGNVTNLDSMFMSDIRLRHLNLSNLDTHNVTNMHAMFMSDQALSDLQGINQLNTGKVTNMISMFSRDRSLPQLRLDHWDTSNVTSMAGMFSGDIKLRDLDLSGFNTLRVSDMSSMFTQDDQLRDLNLANFDTRHVHAIFPGMSLGGMSFMFSGDNYLDKLTVGSHTNLNQANQNWASPFFDQIYNVNGNDTTIALKTGRQPAGTYYSSNYYNHILLVQQYFAAESEIADQVLLNTNVKKDPQAHSQVQQDIDKADAIEKSAYSNLNTKSVNSKILNDINSISSLTNTVDDQVSSADQWVASSSASSSASLASYQASVASLSTSESLSASASTSVSLSVSAAASLQSSETSVSNALTIKQLSSYINELTADGQTIVDHDNQSLAALNNLHPLNHSIQSEDIDDMNELINNRNTVDLNATLLKADLSKINAKQSSADLESLIHEIGNDVNRVSNSPQRNKLALRYNISRLASMNNSIRASLSASSYSNAMYSASVSMNHSISASASASVNNSNSFKEVESAKLSAKSSALAELSVEASLNQSALAYGMASSESNSHAVSYSSSYDHLTSNMSSDNSNAMRQIDTSSNSENDHRMSSAVNSVFNSSVISRDASSSNSINTVYSNHFSNAGRYSESHKTDSRSNVGVSNGNSGNNMPNSEHSSVNHHVNGASYNHFEAHVNRTSLLNHVSNILHRNNSSNKSSSDLPKTSELSTNKLITAILLTISANIAVINDFVDKKRIY